MWMIEAFYWGPPLKLGDIWDLIWSLLRGAVYLKFQKIHDIYGPQFLEKSVRKRRWMRLT